MFNLDLFSTVVLVASFVTHQVAANWDPATGHLRDFQPTDKWIAAHPPKRTTKAIQVAECATNTRLAFPDVQVFTWFSVDHACDAYHGCPYGTCYAFTVFPQPDEFVVNFTNSHSFFWHDTGGIPGTQTNPIANPQTGGFGYESSLDGVYHDGKADVRTEQIGHDNNYPNFHPESLPKWTQEARDKYASQVVNTLPIQPKCGLPHEPNKDPGSIAGAFGNYHPRPASDYQPPTGYVPGPSDKTPPAHNTTQSPPAHNTTQPPPAHNPTQPYVPIQNSSHHGSTHKPKHHGHHQAKGHNTTTPVQGRCKAFCECNGGCGSADEACHTTCQVKHSSCDPQSCQEAFTYPDSMTKRHLHRSSHH
ncbi:secreted protein [Melampsora americana]|nr:secreted protein [Melampsora americana]